jgi:hypothetical protein
VLVERDALTRRAGLGQGEGHAQDGVRAEVACERWRVRRGGRRRMESIRRLTPDEQLERLGQAGVGEENEGVQVSKRANEASRANAFRTKHLGHVWSTRIWPVNAVRGVRVYGWGRGRGAVTV